MLILASEMGGMKGADVEQVIVMLSASGANRSRASQRGSNFYEQVNSRVVSTLRLASGPTERLPITYSTQCPSYKNRLSGHAVDGGSLRQIS